MISINCEFRRLLHHRWVDVDDNFYNYLNGRIGSMNNDVLL
jgi:hypothetical protein